MAPTVSAFGCVVCAAALVAAPVLSQNTLAATDPLVQWGGRHVRDTTHGTVSFDWLGVTARLSVQNATYVAINVTTSAARGTRIKSWVSDQGFSMFPMTEAWVEGALSAHAHASSSRRAASESTLLWTAASPSHEVRLVTVSNNVAPQYATGLTTVASFATDGSFLASPTQTRRLEFVGDSITAATNVRRPAGAPHCGDAGLQSDWAASYSGLLCARLNASCSVIAVGGKCLMRECGGLQMPDYYGSTLYTDAPRRTYTFGAGGAWRPDGIVINLGTNDMRVIKRAGSPMAQRFTKETLAFMRNASLAYSGNGSGPAPNITFFLTSGPMENTTMAATQAAVAAANAEGLRAVWVDMRDACVDADLHAPDDTDGCDGCAGHPGVQGHRGMTAAALPVISRVMGWAYQ